MILLDWTRMGANFCVAGAVVGNDGVNIVRPLMAQSLAGSVRNYGWPAHALRGHGRWEVFELVGLEQAEPQPPHLEDCWVRSLRPRGRSAGSAERKHILEATAKTASASLFGVPLIATRAAAYLKAGTGERS